MLKLPYSAPTACVGWFSDKVSLLLNYTLWGVILYPCYDEFCGGGTCGGGGGSLMCSEVVFLCDGKLDVSLPCRDDEPFSYVLI